MKDNNTTLVLNGKKYSSGALLSDSVNIVKSYSAPGWQKKIHLFIQEWLSPSPYIEVTTSGSTGTPKNIRFSKDFMVKSALRTGNYLGLKPEDRALLCLPVDYIAGKMMVVRALVLGLDLWPVYPSSNPLQDVIGDFDFAAMTPMQVHHILDAWDGVAKLNRIKSLIIGGGEMDASLSNRVSSLSTRIFHTYGMTETLTHVAMKLLTGEKPQSVYRALEGIYFEQDERNCLVIKDLHLGFDNLVTNDLVELISDSEFNFLGRMDHVINSGGIKIIPELVENKLKSYIPNRFIIAGQKDKLLGEKVILIVEIRDSKKPGDLQSVLRQSLLEKYEIPREIYYVDFFPESSVGKIQRKKLLQRISRKNDNQESG